MSISCLNIPSAIRLVSYRLDTQVPSPSDSLSNILKDPMPQLCGSDGFQ